MFNTPCSCTGGSLSSHPVANGDNILSLFLINLFLCKGSYSAISNNMKLAHWPLMGGLLHLVQQGGEWAGLHATASRPVVAVPNVTPRPISSQCTNH